MKTVETVAADALLLPKDQRYTLAHRILVSLEPEVVPGIEEAWDAEIQERIKRHDAGSAPTVPGARVFADLDEQLKK
jgi:hypothetical protein